MKSPRFNISFQEELHADLARLAASRGLSTAGLVRQLVADELSSITGKTYSEIQHGGARQRPRKSCKKLPAIDPLPDAPKRSRKVA